jgi:hypothetical protein
VDRGLSGRGGSGVAGGVILNCLLALPIWKSVPIYFGVPAVTRLIFFLVDSAVAASMIQDGGRRSVLFLRKPRMTTGAFVRLDEWGGGHLCARNANDRLRTRRGRELIGAVNENIHLRCISIASDRYPRSTALLKFKRS